MTQLKQQMIVDMSLSGLSERTQECYQAAVRELANYYNRSPELISEDELKLFFMYLKNERGLAKATLRQKYSGIRFLFINTLKSNFPVFAFLKVGREKKLPTVLSRDEVFRGISGVKNLVYRMVLKLIYSGGLRISEALNLRAADIDRERMLYMVRLGKGGKDRCIPLCPSLLKQLEKYWRKDRRTSSTDLFFPSQYHKGAIPIHSSSVRIAFQSSLRTCGIKKSAALHTLRHSCATHLLEAGVSLKLIQHLLGHNHLGTTLIYIHVSNQGLDNLRNVMSKMVLKI